MSDKRITINGKPTLNNLKDYFSYEITKTVTTQKNINKHSKIQLIF